MQQHLRKKFFWNFDKNDFSRDNFCEKSIACITKHENASLTLIHGNKNVYWSENMKIRLNTHSYFPESGWGKHFQTSGMRLIDFSHKITLRKVIFAKNFKIFLLLQSLPPLRIHEKDVSCRNFNSHKHNIVGYHMLDLSKYHHLHSKLHNQNLGLGLGFL